jgi:hypothetical protein
MNYSSVMDPHHFADPDSTNHHDADPDPTFHPDADPDSGFFYFMQIRI